MTIDDSSPYQPPVIQPPVIDPDDGEEWIEIETEDDFSDGDEDYEDTEDEAEEDGDEEYEEEQVFDEDKVPDTDSSGAVSIRPTKPPW